MPKIIYVEDGEYWDPEKHEFSVIKGGKLKIEHSLLSIFNWEGITEKSFLDMVNTNQKLTDQEFKMYVKCMTIGSVDPNLYNLLSKKNIIEIQDYMNRNPTATRFNERPGPGGGYGEQSTAEMIYYQMFSLGIDKSCEKWHINRLLTLIKLMSRMNEKAMKGDKGKRKMTSAEISARNKLNEERRKMFGG